MSGLEDLYREIVLDHYKSPRNRGELEPPAVRAEGLNPLCGDEVVVFVDLDGDTVRDIRIGGQGCSISQSSASMMSAAVKGKTLAEIDELTHAFKALLTIHEHTHDGEETFDHPTVKLGELEALRGVVKFPTRIKCATLSWNTLAEAIGQALGGTAP
ncbi:MAG: SUF system NifU family Fe-S cluster assembly protein [Acidimicrobiia bacterium]|nr:SUF system NifU family Fe-S cluster assembly protein [Acidimicrobiia bacterium]